VRGVAIRVLVCDDSLGFPALVAAWLKADDRFEHVGTAADGGELLRLAGEVPADAVVLDLVLPDVSNPGALVQDLRARRPGIKVLLVSSLATTLLARAAHAAGVDGHLHKVTNAAELGDALMRIAAPERA
jgi:DNA-binding NarL/FixJ family response regulator